MSEEKTNSIVSKEEEGVKESSKKDYKSLLLDKAKLLPSDPGCYLMQNKYGEIIYIGKAKNLQKRVQSYFNKSAKMPKTQILVRHIRDFDFMITQNETESYILENNLIKKHLPKYNIRLRDDKTYPYVSINFNEDFPRLDYTRRPQKTKGVQVLGPFPVGSNISLILKTLTKAFQLRDCSVSEFKNRKEPCLLYQLKQCSAPCVDKISSTNYEQSLQMALNFFGSKRKRIQSMEYLTSEMMKEAERESFERAAFLRDSIEVLDKLQSELYKQDVELQSEESLDVVAFYVGDKEVDISFYLIREGNLIGQKNFHFSLEDFEQFGEAEKMNLLLQYYGNSKETLPEKVLIDFENDAKYELDNVLKEIAGKDLKLKRPNKKFMKVYESVLTHAKESQRIRQENQESPYIGLDKLKQLLKLKDRPTVLECYDIAVWQGKSPTGAQVVSINGTLEKKLYRYYHMQERVEGNNDFAMMEEMLNRRLKKGHLPDIFVIDGGMGQVNAVKKALENNKVDIPVIGIAKAKNLKARTDERLIIPGRMNPYLLYKCAPLMRIIVSLRDEAHRFSRKLHHKTEHKRVLKSWVDNIKGISESARNEILRFTNMAEDELSELSYTELEQLYPLDKSVIKKLHLYLQGN